MIRGRDIVCLASAPWDVPYRVNCHHLMRRLSVSNRVLYVDTIGARNATTQDLRKLLRRLRSAARGLQRRQDDLTVLSPVVVPAMRSSALVRNMNMRLLAAQIQHATRVLRFHRPIIWVFNPLMYSAARRLERGGLIYYCVDDYSSNPGVDPADVASAEDAVARDADVVITTSRPLFESKRSMNSHTVLLENVADADHFGQASGQVPADVAHFRHPILGFYGNLTSAKLDFDLIAEVADLRPNWTILLIGPGGVGGPDVDLGLLRLHSNIHILGPRSYEGLPDYLAAFDVAMLPYRMNDLTASSFPLKFFEYLAAGKPVVGTDLPALSEYRGWYLTARSPADFAEAAEVGLFESDDRRRNERRAFAQQHNWNSRMLELGAIITRVLDQQ